MTLYGVSNHIFQNVPEFYLVDFEDNQIEHFLKFIYINLKNEI